MELLDWSRIANAGALLGKAKVRLPCGIEISDVAIFQKDGRRWALELKSAQTPRFAPVR
jgi:hypothetical protein